MSSLRNNTQAFLALRLHRYAKEFGDTMDVIGALDVDPYSCQPLATAVVI